MRLARWRRRACSIAAMAPTRDMAPAPNGAARVDLARVLGPWAAGAIVVGTMLGTGIFIVPSTMARQAGSVPVVMLAWVVGGLLALFGALSYAELATAMRTNTAQVCAGVIDMPATAMGTRRPGLRKAANCKRPVAIVAPEHGPTSTAWVQPKRKAVRSPNARRR